MPAEGAMKHLRSIFIFTFLSVGFAQLFAFGAKDLSKKKLTVYTTKSFAADYGPGPKIAEVFKAKTGAEIEYVVCNEGVLNRAIVEGKNITADVLVGIDNHQIAKAKKAKILKAYKPKNIEDKISNEIIISDDWLLTPFDYGFFAFMYDTNSKLKTPFKLSELTNPEYKGKIVVLDPRTSTPGLGFAVWTKAVFGDSYLDFWKEFKKSVFTLAPKWSTGYGLFTSGEAPFAFSYTSSLASHVLYDKTMRFQPLIFDEGHIVHVEGMGISAYSKKINLAKEFIEFMLTEEAQSTLPETQFMFPAVKNINLPDSFKTVPKPSKILKFNADDETEIIDAVINVLQN